MLHTIVFIVSVDESAHAIVPELNDSIVKTGEDPGTGRVKGQTY